MRKHSYLAIVLILVVILCLFIPSCSKKVEDSDIVIVYTTDVHCGVDENIGYASLAAYVKKTKEVSKNFTLIDAGDAMQGNLIGSLSKGKYIIDIMNALNYDLYAIGNHEFDYGIDELSQRIDQFKGKFISCNLSYTGKKENKISKVKPYSIKDYGFAKVGFVGVTTPTTLVSSNPANFVEDGEVVYSFHADTLFDEVQKNIDECKANGCKYVVLVSHLGYIDNYKPYSSVDLINNTSGAIAVIDGHSHQVASCNYYKDKAGQMIPLCAAGYKMNVIGRITITKDGDVQLGIINSYPQKDQEAQDLIDGIEANIDEEVSKVVANSDLAMSIFDAAGIRMVRSREMAIADVVADSYRDASGADIAFANGGGVRADLKSGDITYGDIKNVLPFDNTLCLIKATGAQILDYLEFAARKTEHEYTDGTKAIGENGAFAQASGLTYTIDTSIASSVVVDESGNFVKVDGERRVKNVKVLQGDEYIAIDPEKTYTICSLDFILLDGGDGVVMFKECEVISKNVMLDSEALVRYIVDVLHGSLKDKYETVGNRIIIV